ncbi:MAG: hypothetical protein U1E60_09150 [Reyranellaceae bacterium]
MASLSPSDQVALHLTALSEAQRGAIPPDCAGRYAQPAGGRCRGCGGPGRRHGLLGLRAPRGAAILGNDSITAIDRRVAVQMQAFLDAPPAVPRPRRCGRGRAQRPERRPEVEQFALHALGTISAVTAFSYADPDGNFLFVIRNDKGGFDSKLIERQRGDKRSVTWTRRDGQGNTTTVETADPADTSIHARAPGTKAPSAPRSRTGARRISSSPLKKPGITLSIPHFDAEGKP